MSKYENKIMELLKAAKLSFYREKTFKDLKNGLFRFDFYLQTKEKYKADRAAYLTLIRDDVLKQVGEPIRKNEDDLEALKISARDVLREKIMRIYHTYKHDRAFPLYEKEALEQYYKDYKRLLGNSYIDKYYGRMTKWEIIYEDYDDDE